MLNFLMLIADLLSMGNRNVLYDMLTAAASRERCLWIVKPAASSRGRGIFLITSVRKCNSAHRISSVRLNVWLNKI